MIIDTHAHLNFKAYREDLDAVIKRTIGNGIQAINVGSKYETSKQAVILAEKYEGMYASVGLHPIYSGAEFVKVKTDPDEGEFLIREEGFDYDKYKELAKSSKVVAIGEIGLDYYYRPKTKTKLEAFKNRQKEDFLKQLDLAKELDLPVIFHSRMAHKDMIDILKQKKDIKGVIHCFTGNWQEAQEYLNMGFYLGINGIIFKLDISETIEKAPLDKLLVETDSPYLTPPQKKGRNEPMFITHVIDKMAEIRKTGYNEIEKATYINAKKLFKI